MVKIHKLSKQWPPLQWGWDQLPRRSKHPLSTIRTRRVLIQITPNILMFNNKLLLLFQLIGTFSNFFLILSFVKAPPPPLPFWSNSKTVIMIWTNLNKHIWGWPKQISIFLADWILKIKKKFRRFWYFKLKGFVLSITIWFWIAE